MTQFEQVKSDMPQLPDDPSALVVQSGKLVEESLDKSIARQIKLHENHDNNQSILSKAVSWALWQTNKTDSSLEHLKQAQKELHSDNLSDTKRNRLNAKVQKEIEADAEKLSSRDYYTGIGTGFIKSATLFTRGKFGFVATGLLHGLDKLNTNKSNNWEIVRDAGLGVGEGMLTRGAFGLADRFHVSTATKGILLGAPSRFIGSGLASENLFDEKTGKLTIGNALYHATHDAGDRTSLAFDVLSFGAAHSVLGKTGTSALLQNNKWLAHGMTGLTFGLSNGFSGNILGQIKQLQGEGKIHEFSYKNPERFAKETYELWRQLDFAQAMKAAAERGALDTAAAMTGHGVSHGVARTNDYVNVKTGRGIKLDRYVERHLGEGLKQSPLLAELVGLIKQNGIGRDLRILPGADSTYIDHGKGRIYLAKGKGAAELGHELTKYLTLNLAGRANLIQHLANGWEMDNAKKVIDMNLLTQKELRAPEIREAARTGLAQCLSSGYIVDAKEVIDMNLLTQNEIREAARTGLAKCLSSGYVVGAKKVIGMNLLTQKGLRAPEIREAARDGLANCLANGWIDNANKVIGLKLLTQNEIREAARDGLANCLANGWIDYANKVIELELLDQNGIREAATDGLANCLANGRTNNAKIAISLRLLDKNAIDACFKQSAQAGHITSVVRTALTNRMDLNSTFARYLDISKLTDETAIKLYADLKQKDSVWQDIDNIQRPFEEGAVIFGGERMLRYVFKTNATLHDALHDFNQIVELYHRSGLTPEKFYGNILLQVNKDNGLDDTGSSCSRFNTIARNFPTDINAVLQKAREYPDIKTLQQLLEAFPDKESVFASWQNLQRFAKLQHLIGQAQLLSELQQLKQNNQNELANWIEALAFHPDSKVSINTLLKFWKEPGKFLEIGETHSPKTHELKKPSHYTDIPHLDLNPVELRDALVEGALDRLQVFSPMKVEYEIGGNDIDLAAELSRALGSHRKSIPGEAKSPTKLFSEVNNALKSTGFSLAQVLNGTKLPSDLQQRLEAVIYNSEFGAQRPQSGLRLIAEIHRKSDPLSVVAGDDTACCMPFGSGKNNVYMFNPNDALFTVRLVRADGTSRTIAQSVLTKDKDVKIPFPTLLEKMQGNDRAALHKIVPEEALRGQNALVAADNVEVHPNYKLGGYPKALEAVYRDFFARYTQLHGGNENLRKDKLVIGQGHSDAMQSLPKELNTYVPQAPVGYTDKYHNEVLSLSLTKPQKVRVHVLNIEHPVIENRIKPQAAVTPGVSPLTVEDTLSTAYLEGKVYQDNLSLHEGAHNMQNVLTAKDINNAAKERPNLSLKYLDQNGKMIAYLLAYEGRETYNEKVEPIIFISDFASDRPMGDRGTPIPNIGSGKLLLEFGKLYKEHYLDQGKLIPIFTNARDETSYRLLTRQIESLGNRVGCRFEVRQLGTHQAGENTMYDVLIIPHPISSAPSTSGLPKIEFIGKAS